MSKDLIAKANELAKDFGDRNKRMQLMSVLSQLDTLLEGVNQNGEDILISGTEDGIVLTTFQNNGWTRVNYYDEYGYQCGETFEGRWR